MALVNRSFSVNVTPGMMPPIVHVSEYDVGRAYTVSILDEQGNTFTIPSGTTASIEGTLNGSVGFTQSATVSNNQVSFTLSQSMTAYSGKAWCKIKLTQNSQPIQTCAFVLAVDRAGVEADTILHSPGFQEQINEGIAEYFDNDPPFFVLPSGGQSGQALLSDGEDGAVWGEAGIPEAVKTALLACFQNVAWINNQGQTYYNALYSALNSGVTPPPSEEYTWTYYASSGLTLTQRTDIVTQNITAGTVTEELVNGKLHLVAEPGNNGRKWDFVQSTNTSAKLLIRFMLVDSPAANSIGGFQPQLSNGTSGAKFGTRRTANTGDVKAVTGIGTSYTDHNITLNEWHTLAIDLNNGKQSVYLDEVALVENANPVTEYCVNNRVFIQNNTTPGNTHNTEVYIDWIKYLDRSGS